MRPSSDRHRRSELGKNVDVDLAIVGDAAYVLNAMLPMIEDKKHPDWMKMIHECRHRIPPGIRRSR